MAELTSFGYLAGDTLLHHLDARFKILCVILLSVVSLNLKFLELGVMTVLLLGAIFYARLPLLSGLKELRYFSVLLFLIIIARALSQGGTLIVDHKFIAVSRQGLYDGALICWRLAFVVILGFAFVSTTRPSAIKAAVRWFLKPVPFIPQNKVAIMMGLILRFIPLIFNQAGEIGKAQKARCVENRKNPVYRLTKLGFPILRRTFESADNLATAMEARAFTENRTDPGLILHKSDWIVLLTIAVVSFSMLIL